MPFPSSERVIYRKNPLFEVISQVRFPSILRIEKDIPADFQDKIRTEYPISKNHPIIPNIAGLPPNFQEAIPAVAGMPQRRAWEFLSENGIWKITLTQESLAITTTQYEQWEDFRSRFQDVLNAFKEIYHPSFYTRIGLRYRDAIEKKSLGLEDCAWSELFRKEIAAELSALEIADDVKEVVHHVLLSIPDYDGLVRLQHGLALHQETKTQGYIIDADYFTNQRMEVDNVFSVLDKYNKWAGRLFRWCITDRLHEAMEPFPAISGR